jgi:hypothetical protein
MIYWQLRVKFRAFGITFGSVDEVGSIHLMAGAPPLDRVVYDQRGVHLRIWTE